MQLTTGSFYGIPTGIIRTDNLAVEFLASAALRIVRLSLGESNENLLAETPEVRWETPYGMYRLYGGHRLWYAPEVFPETSFPDSPELQIEQMNDGVRLTQPPESISGLSKSIELHEEYDRPGLTLVHSLQNRGDKSHELALWPITQLPLGGVAILPQPANASEAERLVPDRHLALWSYARWTDARLHLEDGHVRVYGLAQLPPLKIGYFNTPGWTAYLREGFLFVKRFDPAPGLAHADLNSNTEVYVNDRYIEIETLGPLTQLQPGQSIRHVETWEAYAGLREWSEAEPLVENRK